jgi:hypothetical protein
MLTRAPVSECNEIFTKAFTLKALVALDHEIPVGCAWTAEHTAQGFARRQSTVNFGTLLEFGYADVAIAVTTNHRKNMQGSLRCLSLSRLER